MLSTNKAIIDEMTGKSLFTILFLLILSFCQSCAQTPQPFKNIKIGVISDSHYLSERLMSSGVALSLYEQSSGKWVSQVPEILDQVLADYLASDIEVLLICGDITKDGESVSHRDFISKLQPLRKKGIRIFVIPGNHDVNTPVALAYHERQTKRVKNISASDFENIYGDFGYNESIKRDSTSLSYVAALNDDTWLLAIDSNLYKGDKNQNRSEGAISFETEKWIIRVLEEARNRNIQVVGMMHHGLVEHILMQSVYFSEYLVKDWERLAALFADLGMNVIFTGHFHATDITRYTSPNENVIYDIETSSLSAYPFSYRFVTLGKDGLSVITRNITETQSVPNLEIEGRVRLQNQARQLAVQKLRSKGMGLSIDVEPFVAELLSEIFVLHVKGDEIVDDKLKTTISKLLNKMDIPFDNLEQFPSLDFYPADNNVEIKF